MAHYFHERYTCRLKPWPDWLVQDSNRMNVQLTLHLYTSDLPRTGPLGAWDIRPRLGEIHIPTLVTAGRYDGTADGQEQLLHDGIVGSELVIFSESAHYAHAEEPQRYLSVLSDFLTRVEQDESGAV